MTLLVGRASYTVTSGVDDVTSGGFDVTVLESTPSSVLILSDGSAVEIGLGVTFTSIPSGIGAGRGESIIALFGDRDRQPITLASVICSWGVNEAGEFSGFASVDAVRELSDNPEDLRGKWLIWQHTDLGTWGGVITDVAATTDQTIEIGARGWLSLLDKRLTRRRDRAVIAHAGPIAGRIVRDAGGVAPTGITGISVDEVGPFVAWTDNGGSVLDALSQLADLSGQEYCVDPVTRRFEWRAQCGTDRRNSVQLVGGTHVVDWRPAWSLDPVITEVVLEPSDPSRFPTAPSVSGNDATAYALYGPRQVRGSYHGRLSRAAARSAASTQAGGLAKLGRLIELAVVNVDACFGWFEVGDSITVVIPTLDRALVVRTLLTSYDQDAELLRVSGEVVGG